jgi:Protein of unknown function (DUF4065)
MQENIQFDREKFKDVIHFIVSHAETTFGRSALGNVKLHKALYYSDFLTYLATMRPLTGEDYQRQKFGPTARHLSAAIRELVSEDRIRVDDEDYFGYPKKDYRCLVAPRTNRLSEGERNSIEVILKFVCGRTASEISDFSHDDVWASVGMGDRIPYFAAFAFTPVEVTDEDIAQAVAEAQRIAPIIEAETGYAR